MIDEAKDIKGADTPPPTPIFAAPPARSSSLKLEMPKFLGQIVDWHDFWVCWTAKWSERQACQKSRILVCMGLL